MCNDKVVNKLIKKNKLISIMESCTGGGFANSITNISGASEVFNFAAVTYSNEYKIRFGVDSKLIDTYSVYSIEVAKDMSKKICEFSKSDYGVGITGKLNSSDQNNKFGADNKVYASIYENQKDSYHELVIEVNSYNKEENKQLVIDEIMEKLYTILK